jgi:hypothetical protein
MYCWLGVCRPADWWSAAAAWAQALLTVATFAGTVIYQVRSNSAKERAEETRRQKADIEEKARELTMARLVSARELRRWRRAIRRHLHAEFDSVQAEAEHSVATAREIVWRGSTEDLRSLGRLGEVFVKAIAIADDLTDKFDDPEPDASPTDSYATAERAKDVREQWRKLERGVTECLGAMAQAGRAI